MGGSGDSDLSEGIVRQERRVAQLAAEWAAASRRLEDLRRQESTITPADGDAVVSGEASSAGRGHGSRTPETNEGKVALFAALFRGRTDVFPRFWKNARTDRSGYAPACANEWVRGVCEKPRVRCGECPNQAFVPVTQAALRDHLRGRHVVGVYPLLPDETCWFLAMDFDGDGWHEDARAVVQAARGSGLAPALERSRSGKGAHVWLFFAAPVPAQAARTMGCHLLTEAMAHWPSLPMGSYDRLFPNQDTMPRGGFGNLIALPLQHDARRLGNTVFLDDTGEPFADQWGYLASVAPVGPETVVALARRAAETGRVVGLSPVAGADGDEAPWRDKPPGQRSKVGVDGPLPDRVRVVMGQQLFVDKEGLPPGLIDRVRGLAAFQNPEFYRRQALRLSTALTPRVIDCAEDLPRYVGLPRGCLDELAGALRDHGIELQVDDQRTEGAALGVRFEGELTELQQEAVEALLRHDTGVLVAPPGTGKTVAGTWLIAARGRSTLVLVHRTQLLEQWRAQLSLFLGMAQGEIGQVGGGRRKVTGNLDVAMIQSLVRRESVDDRVAGYGHVVVDECHHVPAVSFERAMKAVRARYVTGLTATPQRRDGHDPILSFQLGPVRWAVDARSQAARHRFEHRLTVRETAFRLDDGVEDTGIQGLYSRLAADASRNEMILDDVIGALAEGRSPILLSERRDHVEYLADRLRHCARHLVVLRGGMGVRQRREATEALREIHDGEERLVVATGRFIGEGFDDARLDTLFLTLPVSWKGTLVQYAGRLHRSHGAKREVRIVDYVDREVPMLARMFGKRLRGYRAMGYRVAPASVRGLVLPLTSSAREPPGSHR